MSTELQQRPDEFVCVDPKTGEALTLDAPNETLIAYLANVGDLQASINDYKRVVQQEILRRMDLDRGWTLRAPGLEINAPSDAMVEEFDELALREELLKCVDRGELSIEAVDRAVETIVTYKVKKSGLNAIRKKPGMEDRVNQYRQLVPPRRYPRITRSGT